MTGESAGQRPFLSIVVPAFNEEHRLPETLRRILAFSEKQEYASEVIVVDNGSTDMTARIVSDFASRAPSLKQLHEPVRGKGAAVRTGILAAQGEYLLVSDADLAVPIEEVRLLIPPLFSDYDIAIGSREAEGANRFKEPFHRHAMGRVFNMLVQSVALPGLSDTQCGFKLFRRDAARDLFSRNRINGWSFDVEILFIARLRGYRIVEVPVNWYYGEKSKVNALRDTWRMFVEVLRIRRNGRKGLYG